MSQDSHKVDDEDSQPSGRDQFARSQLFNIAGLDHSAGAPSSQHSGHGQSTQPAQLAEHAGPEQRAESPVQDLNVDPHALVAIQTVASWKYPTNINKRHNSGKYPPKNGILPVDHDPTNTRTINILDAFASIAIYKPKGQVVAVAMQMDHEQERICLTIAENDTVPDEVIKHIEKVWGMLRELSDEYAKNRNLETPRGYREKSPEMPVIPSASRIKEMIGTEVYRFSSQKLIARSKKRMAALWNYIVALYKAHKDGSLGDDKQEKALRESLLGGLTSLVEAYKWDNVSNKQLPIQDWVEFYKLITEAAELLDPVLNHTSVLERWTEHLGFGKSVLSL
jgi:hypothetical protein